MIWFKKQSADNLGKYNTKLLREKLGLNNKEFNTLIKFEGERYKKMIIGKHGKVYYESKIKDEPLKEKYGNIPIFEPMPGKSESFMFNEKSGVHLEKTWSSKNKYNVDKKKPFNFIFTP